MHAASRPQNVEVQVEVRLIVAGGTMYHYTSMSGVRESVG